MGLNLKGRYNLWKVHNYFLEEIHIKIGFKWIFEKQVEDFLNLIQIEIVMVEDKHYFLVKIDNAQHLAKYRQYKESVTFICRIGLIIWRSINHYPHPAPFGKKL